MLSLCCQMAKENESKGLYVTCNIAPGLIDYEIKRSNILLFVQRVNYVYVLWSP